MKTFNLFISHGWKDTEEYQKVIGWLNKAQEEGRLSYRNYSDPNNNPIIESDQTIKNEKMNDLLASQIDAASIVIVLSGLDIEYSGWIDFQIDTAVAKKKYLIGLIPWGEEAIPPKILKEAHEMVGWNYDALIKAILSSKV